jgi:hypothetical protein
VTNNNSNDCEMNYEARAVGFLIIGSRKARRSFIGRSRPVHLLGVDGKKYKLVWVSDARISGD